MRPLPLSRHPEAISGGRRISFSNGILRSALERREGERDSSPAAPTFLKNSGTAESKMTSKKIKTTQVGKKNALAMTYFLVPFRKQYRQRCRVSLLSSEWNQVVPRRSNNQSKFYFNRKIIFKENLLSTLC